MQQEDEEQIFEADDDDNELSIPKANYSSSKTYIIKIISKCNIS